MFNEAENVSLGDIVQSLEALQVNAKVHAYLDIIAHLHRYQTAKNIVAMLNIFVQKVVVVRPSHQEVIIP